VPDREVRVATVLPLRVEAAWLSSVTRVALLLITAVPSVGCAEPPPVERIQAYADALAVGDGSAACAFRFPEWREPKACAEHVEHVRKAVPFLVGGKVRATQRWVDSGDTLAHVVVEARGPGGTGSAYLIFGCPPGGSCIVHNGGPLFVLSVERR
jgi:hypothetical protein